MHLLTHSHRLQILYCFTVGFSLSYALIWLILKWARNRGERGRDGEFHHGHKIPVPRLGGIALASAFALSAVSIYLFLPISASSAGTLVAVTFGSLAMFGLGLWDDLSPLSAKFKLVAQVAISSVVYFGNIRIDIFKNPLTDTEISLGVFGYSLTVLWLVSVTNLINLIDGIDGLAGGICLMLMFLLANVAIGGDSGISMLLAITVAGSLIAFLRFNYPPAKIYMGDGGAYFLGFVIGVLSIVNSNKGTVAAALIAPAFALALPIVDVGLAVLRRGLRGLPVFRPDQKHIHHHLITLGISRERTLLNLYTVCLLCLFLAFGVFYLQGRMLPLYTGLLFLVLIIAGHMSGYTKNWFEISSQLGKSLALRKETQYALTLNRWLVMEVERHGSVDELWEDYQFVIRKLGFSRVKIALPNGTSNTWQAEDFEEGSSAYHFAAHEISDGTVIEVAANKSMMPDILFNLLGDLTAETWYKIALRWRMLNKTPLRFPLVATELITRRELQPDKVLSSPSGVLP
jgi:UDP-GlcNAc:undecaprenyl-phosphate GlcNAc-1-phosphate transferase